MSDRPRRNIRHYEKQYFTRRKLKNETSRSKVGQVTGGRKKSTIYLDRDFGNGDESLELEHLKFRFLTFIGIGGTLQRISEETGIDRNSIIIPGPSEFQDQSAPLINGRIENHAAHLIQGRIKSNPILTQRHLKELMDILGHTDILPVDLNQRTAAIIDNTQAETLEQGLLSNINFTEEFNEENFKAVKEILAMYQETINKELTRRGGPYDNDSFEKAIANDCYDIQRDLLDQAIRLFSNEDLPKRAFLRGQEDYKAKFTAKV